MSISISRSKQLIICLFFFAAFYSYAGNTYTTIENGVFNDPSIWSLDGGVSNCNCVPAIPTDGDNIVINHSVTLVDHLNINNGSSFTVSPTGSVYGPSFNLVAWGNADVLITGTSTFNKLINGLVNGTNGANILINGTIVEFNGRVILYSGVTTLESSYVYLTMGNFDVLETAEFYTSGTSKLELFNGNITNNGFIEICAECCLTTKGNWTNETTGTVAGFGSATTAVGNMKNLNIWSLDITWCSAGSDFGMPSNEDCSSSNLVCGAVALPVELVLFEGANRGSYNELNWETASEVNSDYFRLLRSYDGFNWVEVTVLSAAGNSTTTNFYSSRDHSYQKDKSVVYYRLEQVDLDGKRNFSAPISVSNELKNVDLLVYPNPVGQEGIVHVTGMQNTGTIRIINGKGENMELEANYFNGQYEIPTSQLSSGIYFVEFYDSEGEIFRTRFIVQ